MRENSKTIIDAAEVSFEESVAGISFRDQERSEYISEI
jgi:hypothetical protein